MFDYSWGETSAMILNWWGVLSPTVKLLGGVGLALIAANWVIGERSGGESAAGPSPSPGNRGRGVLGRLGSPRGGRSMGKVPTWRNEPYYRGGSHRDADGGWGVLEDRARTVNDWQGDDD